jgi:hypothetical protein
MVLGQNVHVFLPYLHKNIKFIETRDSYTACQWWPDFVVIL